MKNYRGVNRKRALIDMVFWCLMCMLVCISASFQHGDIVVEGDDDGVLYVNDDMSLADTDSVNELAFEVSFTF